MLVIYLRAQKGLDMRVVQALGAIAIIGAAVVYWNFGTLSPCGMLRESVRHHDGLAAVLPDSIVDLAIAAQYGAMSSGRCLEVLLNKQRPAPVASIQTSRQQTVPAAKSPPAPTAAVAQNPMQWATQITIQANSRCRAKRLRGDLSSHVASVQCSNPTMIAAFNEAHYRYMDLIEFFATKRLELAAKIDRDEITEQQAQIEANKLYASLQETERHRDNGGR